MDNYESPNRTQLLEIVVLKKMKLSIIIAVKILFFYEFYEKFRTKIV